LFEKTVPANAASDLSFLALKFNFLCQTCTRHAGDVT